MILGVDPKVDYAFKRVFGLEKNRDLLASLIEAVLAGSNYGPIADLQILNPFNDKNWPDDKLSILDIKARDRFGRLFDVEMQMLPRTDLRERLLFYWAELFTQQMLEGAAYQAVRPAISICFLDGVLFPNVPAWHSRFTLRDAQHGHRLTDAIEIHLLELPKFQKLNEELAENLDQWLYFLRHGEQFDSVRPPSHLTLPEITKALEELAIMNQDTLERERYLARQKAKRDELSLEYSRRVELAEAIKNGLAQGLQQGLQQGLEQGLRRGELIGVIQTCQELLSTSVDSQDALTALPDEELARRADELKRQLRTRS
ncbi:MAG TPA: Rpn family recombination-promoting nuclease/putative transposase [Planctomycetaceae bacterium]|nr:Rpn family recombination-promoting nuclease/putative transposase [Planctomycetaceae bacterium]